MALGSIIIYIYKKKTHTQHKHITHLPIWKTRKGDRNEVSLSYSCQHCVVVTTTHFSVIGFFWKCIKAAYHPKWGQNYTECDWRRVRDRKRECLVRLSIRLNWTNTIINSVLDVCVLYSDMKNAHFNLRLNFIKSWKLLIIMGKAFCLLPRRHSTPTLALKKRISHNDVAKKSVVSEA